MPRVRTPRFPLAVLAAIVALIGAGPIASAAQFVPRGDLASRLGPAALHLDAGPVTIARLADARRTASLDPVRGEWTLHGLVCSLATQAPTPALRAQVGALARYESQAFTDPPDPDHARGARVPVADVAAAAKATLHAWDVAERAAAYRAAWRSGAPIDGSLDPEAVTAALRTLDPRSIDAALAADGARLPVEALASLALGSGHEALLHRVLVEGRGAASLALVDALPSRLAPDDALRELRFATRNPVLTAAAWRGIARLAPSTSAARDALFAALGDRMQGPAAAPALATLGDAATIARLDALLDTAARDAVARESTTTRRALLVLLRMDGPAARDRLAAFRDDPRQSAALRAEVSGWLP